MPWILIILTYASTDTTPPVAVTIHEVPFSAVALCEAARAQIATDLPTRDVKVRTSCIQVSE